MDGFIKKPKEKCPEEKANILNKLFFWWMKRIFVIGARRDFKVEDMFYPLDSDRAEKISNQLEKAWDRELERNIEYRTGFKGNKQLGSVQPSLCYAICSVFWWDYLECGLQIFLTNVVLKSIQPILQAGIIDYFKISDSGSVTPKNFAFSYAAGLVLTTLFIIWSNNHTYLTCCRVGMRTRVACSSLIYGKILRLSKSALSHMSPEEIVDLFSNDLSRFDVLGTLLHRLWISPIQVIVIGSCLYVTVGPHALVGMGILLVLIVPLQLIINRYIMRLIRHARIFLNRRIEFMEELINGIQVVKMYAWESTFAKMISRTRNSEMQAIRRANYLRALTLAITMFSDKIILFTTLLTYVLMGDTLTAKITFTTALYYSFIFSDTVLGFPMAILQTGEVATSLQKLQNFLMLDEFSVVHFITEEKRKRSSWNDSLSNILTSCNMDRLPRIDETTEVEEGSLTIANKGSNSERVFVEVKKLSANWERDEFPLALCDVSFRVDKGQICALTGQAGSGKTALLSVIIGELPIEEGNLYIGTKITTNFETFGKTHGYVRDTPDIIISYASQNPWLFTGTIRDNVIFGQPWDFQKFQKVTKACALWRDMRQWPQGYSTIIGDRGISLSDSQKARINLARAVYKNADLYLLDDVLSSVDTRLQQHLFEQCINGYLRGKTRIVVTHQHQYLKFADTIVLLDRGLVRGQGNFTDLSESNSEFVRLFKTFKNSDNNEKNQLVENVTNETRTEETELEESESFESISSMNSLSIDWTRDSSVASRVSGENSDMGKTEKNTWGVWSHFFSFGSSLFRTVMLILTLIISQILLTGTDYWISYWSNLDTARRSLAKNSTELAKNKYRAFVNDTIFSYFSLLDEEGLLPKELAIYFYTFLVSCCIVFYIARNFTLMSICVKASSKIHDTMFEKILRATMRFFNDNQPGQIIHRFSKDVGTMDKLLPSGLLDASLVGLLAIGTFVTIAVTNPWMIIPMIVLFPIFHWLMKYYFETAKGIQKIGSICKSPILTQVNATVQGLTTIRNSGPAINEILRRQFHTYLDIHSGTWFLSSAAVAAFSLWLDLCICVFIACVCFIPILLDHGDIFDGTVGLAIWQSLQLTGLLQKMVKQWAEACTHVTAVERILEYSDIKSEGSPASDDPLPSNWPSKGRLSMKNVILRYHEDTLPTLNVVNLTIQPEWKVGVIGCTEADKNALISAIFRLDHERLNGEIKIDGRDTSSVELEEFRSRISIIPHDPILFLGTLRYNLDPFDLYGNAALWDALREVELDHLNIEHPVSEGGTNFTLGQRQLICLARAILKANRILVFDEATDNNDAKTDAIIQNTLKSRFARHTVITVTNRLITVIESDRILVMDSGKVSEFGCPNELIRNNPNGPFANMIQQTGPEMAENLMRLAEAACLGVPAQHSLDLTSVNSEEGAPTNFHRK